MTIESNEVVSKTPEEIYEEVNSSYWTFDVYDLNETRNQLQLYQSDWVDHLENEEKKWEANRQRWFCLTRELLLRRADEHNAYGPGVAEMCVRSPDTQYEYNENRLILNKAKEKTEKAIPFLDEQTREKAEVVLEQINNMLDNMIEPQIPEIRAEFSLNRYIDIKNNHENWNIDNIKIFLTEEEEKILTEAWENGYYMMTWRNYDNRAWWVLFLYDKQGNKVKEITVHAIGNRVNWFSTE